MVETMAKLDMVKIAKEAIEGIVIDGKTFYEWIELMKDYKRHEWISVKDALPETGKNVLFHPVCNEKSVYIGEFAYVGKVNAVYFSVRSGKRKVVYSATHWMPLPELPKEET